MKIKMFLGTALACAVLLTAAGCTAISDEPVPAGTAEGEVSIREVSEKADPQKAISSIYATLEEYSAESLEEEEAEELMGLKASMIQETFAYYSDPCAGLADIVIVKPYAVSRDKIREALYAYKTSRVQEFENYNILGAHDIAQEAIIYDQGEYVILLMLADNDAAKLIVDQYIPQ